MTATCPGGVQAHCRYFVVREFAEVISQGISSRAIQEMLELLFRVYLAYTVSKAEGDFITVSYCTLCQLILAVSRKHWLELWCLMVNSTTILSDRIRLTMTV